LQRPHCNANYLSDLLFGFSAGLYKVDDLPDHLSPAIAQ
jgi:hypothetical protein